MEKTFYISILNEDLTIINDKEIKLMDRIIIHLEICHGKLHLKGTKIFISLTE